MTAATDRTAERMDEATPLGLPTRLALLRGGRVLELAWDDERRSLDAPVLRAACRCAECSRVQRAGCAATIDPALCIRAIEPYGPGAVNIVFSDGHRRGLFPFTYLASLAARARTSEAVIA